MEVGSGRGVGGEGQGDKSCWLLKSEGRVDKTFGIASYMTFHDKST